MTSKLSEIMEELYGASPEELQNEMMAMYREAIAARENVENTSMLLSRTRDLLDHEHRRRSLIEALSCYNESGVTKDQLDRMAAIIWPPVENIHDKPTSINEAVPLHQSEPDFYVSPTWGEARGYYLVGKALVLLNAIASCAEVTCGELWTNDYREFKESAVSFIKKFSDT